MKTKAKSIRAMMTLSALATVIMVLCVAGAPAMAGPMRVEGTVLRDLANLDKLREVLDSRIPSGLIPGDGTVQLPDGGPFPDGGGWEPVFPSDIIDDLLTDEVVDEGVDETAGGAGDAGDGTVDETTGEDVADDAADDVADDAAGDEVVEAGGDADQEMTEGADQVGQTEIDEAEVVETGGQTVTSEMTEQAAELPFTGGNSVPWMIAGAAIAMAGASLLLRRRDRKEDR